MDACGTGFAWNRIRVERLSRASLACCVYIGCVTEDGGNGNFLPFLIIISTERHTVWVVGFELDFRAELLLDGAPFYCTCLDYIQALEVQSRRSAENSTR